MYKYFKSFPPQIFFNDAINAYRQSNLYSKIANKALLYVTGSDSTKFLQGLVTSQMNDADTNGSVSLFLSPQGRILFPVFIYKSHKKASDASYYIETDKVYIEALSNHLKLYKLRSNVQISHVPEEQQQIFQVWGPRSEQVWDSRREAEACISDSRAPKLGYRIIAPKFPPKLAESFQQCSFTDYRLLTGMQALPEYAADLLHGRNNFPQECNFDLMGAINYKKGCYMGQELTIRTHHRGVVRKRIVPVQLATSSEEHSVSSDLTLDLKVGVKWPNPGDLLHECSVSKPATAGRFVTSVAFNLGLALVKLDLINVPLKAQEGNFYMNCKLPTEWKI